VFYKPETYPWTSAFIEKFDEIKKELIQVIDRPLAELNKSTWAPERPNLLTSEYKKEEAWKTYTFRFFGIDHLPNCESCPTVYSLIKNQPKLVTVEFSLLEPNTHVLPHRGFTDLLLRSHLGVKIPEGDSGIKVDGIQKTWENGRFIVFDDSLTHEAWNKTDQQRVVLMIDFVPELSKHSPKEICKIVLHKNTDKHTLAIAPLEKWKEWLEDGQFPTGKK
jgi:aspartyl/asparaginyl beta-hydroxylase (cupin superfamily)